MYVDVLGANQALCLWGILPVCQHVVQSDRIEWGERGTMKLSGARWRQCTKVGSQLHPRGRMVME